MLLSSFWEGVEGPSLEAAVPRVAPLQPTMCRLTRGANWFESFFMPCGVNAAGEQLFLLPSSVSHAWNDERKRTWQQMQREFPCLGCSCL